MNLFSPNVLYWVNLAGALFALFCLLVTTFVPILSGASASFALGGVSFGVGALANYLRLSKEKSSNRTKEDP